MNSIFRERHRVAKKIFVKDAINKGRGDGSDLRSGLEVKLCEICAALDFKDLFESKYRSPDVVDGYLKSINTLENVRRQISCPFCRILLQIISDSAFENKDEENWFNKPQDIYLEPQSADYALCGIQIWGTQADIALASCLHVETGTQIFYNKIVLVPERDQYGKRDLFNLPYRLGDQVDFVAVRQFIENCSLNHTNGCDLSPVDTGNSNFRSLQRLIDVRSRKIVSADLSTVKYAALSYVWGRTVSSQDNESTIGIPPQEAQTRNTIHSTLPSPLAKTFEDAVTVCIKLDVPFLWIDTFCIDQEDEEDKRVQISHMDTIYDGAFLTIIAVEGTNPMAGLSRVPSTQGMLNVGSSRQSLHTENVRGYCLAIVPGFVTPATVWNTRAWTLQETLLSKRLLVFNRDYVSFFCRSGAMREDILHSDSHQMNRFNQWKGSPGSPFTNEYYRSSFSIKSYCNLVSLYCIRDMSDHMDALNAVCGILNIWARSDKIKYIAGLPLTNLTDTLIWQGSNTTLRGHPKLPSWSWAAWQGNIGYYAVTLGVERDRLNQMKKYYNFDLTSSTDVLPNRIISYFQPHTINFGTLLEKEALVEVSTNCQSKARLEITSYVAKFRFSLTSVEAYKRSLSSKEETSSAEKQPTNDMVLIEDDNELYLIFSRRSEYYRLNLPKILDRLDEEKLRNEEVEFLMLKKWSRFQQDSEPSVHHIWALLIMRQEEIAHRLGCVAIPAGIWESGSPRLETVTLE